MHSSYGQCCLYSWLWGNVANAIREKISRLLSVMAQSYSRFYPLWVHLSTLSILTRHHLFTHPSIHHNCPCGSTVLTNSGQALPPDVTNHKTREDQSPNCYTGGEIGESWEQPGCFLLQSAFSHRNTKRPCFVLLHRSDPQQRPARGCALSGFL